MAYSDTLPWSGAPEPSADAFTQAAQTSAARVDLNQGVARLQEAAALGAAARIIGGVNLQNYDRRLNMHKGNLLLGDLHAPPLESSYDRSIDGRPSVFASLAGYVVPSGVRDDSEWRRLIRPLGFAMYDTLIDNAGVGQQPRYGTAIITGGSISLVPHIVPEDIFAGQLLVADIGPMDPVARDQWKANFMFNHTTHTRDSEKPVVRPYNPWGCFDLLGTAFEEYFAVLNEGEVFANVISNPARFGSDVADPAKFAAMGMGKPLMAAVLMGVAVLEQAGYVTLAPTPDKATDLKSVFAFDDIDKDRLAKLAQRLALTGAEADFVLCKAIFGAFWSPLTVDRGLSKAVDFSKALPNTDFAAELQETSAQMLIAAVVDAIHFNQGPIVAKATHNSKQGNSGMDIVITQ